MFIEITPEGYYRIKMTIDGTVNKVWIYTEARNMLDALQYVFDVAYTEWPIRAWENCTTV